MDRTRVVMLGAAGRDFHNFNVAFRDDPRVEVVAFTAAQIPHIAGRSYPPELAGPRYPAGIPVVPERELEALIARHDVHEVVFSYSDVSYDDVMHLSARALACGADFRLLGPRRTMLRAARPVISVCAVRTGAGKSPASRAIVAMLRGANLRVVVVRHPMPYGDLAAQAVQRFASIADMTAARCTIEEMEEYEPHVARGAVVYAGVDYARILARAEAEADVLVWDGGNNDLPFVRPDLEVVLVDPHRAGDETRYYPGEVNLLRAGLVLISKVDTARPEALAAVRAEVARANPGAAVVEARMPVTVADPALIRDRRVLVIEDGPTLTHGGMKYGAGALAARAHGARALVDPRPFAQGALRETFARYPHLTDVLPAMGYGDADVRDLEATVRAADCDAVLVATPIDLRRVIAIDKPHTRATYELEPIGPGLAEAVAKIAAGARAGG